MADVQAVRRAFAAVERRKRRNDRCSRPVGNGWASLRHCARARSRASCNRFSRFTCRQFTSNSAKATRIKRVFLETTVFAFGYSFSDPDINSILQYIADELGGAGQNTHVLLTSDESTMPVDLLRAANFEVVKYKYDPNEGHQEATTLVKGLLRAARTPSPEVTDVDTVGFEEMRALVSLCNSVLSPSRSSTYAAACAAVVLHSLSPSGDWVASSDVLTSLPNTLPSCASAFR